MILFHVFKLFIFLNKRHIYKIYNAFIYLTISPLTFLSFTININAEKHDIEGFLCFTVFNGTCTGYCVYLCLPTAGPAPPRWFSSARPVFGLWSPWWGPPSLPRPPAPGWHTDMGCPPAPSLLRDTASQSLPLTPRAEATSCVERKQEGSSDEVVSVV